MASDDESVKEVPLTTRFRMPAFNPSQFLHPSGPSTPAHATSRNPPSSAARVAPTPRTAPGPAAVPFEPFGTGEGASEVKHTLPPRVRDESSGEKSSEEAGKDGKKKRPRPDPDHTPLGLGRRDDEDDEEEHGGGEGPLKRPAANTNTTRAPKGTAKTKAKAKAKRKATKAGAAPFAYELEHEEFEETECGSQPEIEREWPDNQLGLTPTPSKEDPSWAPYVGAPDEGEPPSCPEPVREEGYEDLFGDLKNHPIADLKDEDAGASADLERWQAMEEAVVMGAICAHSVQAIQGCLDELGKYVEPTWEQPPAPEETPIVKDGYGEQLPNLPSQMEQNEEVHGEESNNGNNGELGETGENNNELGEEGNNNVLGEELVEKGANNGAPDEEMGGNTDDDAGGKTDNDLPDPPAPGNEGLSESPHEEAAGGASKGLGLKPKAAAKKPPRPPATPTAKAAPKAKAKVAPKAKAKVAAKSKAKAKAKAVKKQVKTDVQKKLHSVYSNAWHKAKQAGENPREKAIAAKLLWAQQEGPQDDPHVQRVLRDLE